MNIQNDIPPGCEWVDADKLAESSGRKLVRFPRAIQTANQVEIQNSAGTILGAIASDGPVFISDCREPTPDAIVESIR